jgi:hypothetical protein
MKNNKESNETKVLSLDFFLGWMLFALSIVSAFLFSQIAWSYFIQNCPNQDVLTWDENIRLITVLDQYSDFHLGRIGSAIFPFFESPTWPPLRSFLTLALLYIPTGYSVIVADSFFGLVFLGLSFGSIGIVSYKLTRNYLYAGLITLVSIAFLIHTFEVPAYSLSSMLETQAMFASVWCFYYLFRMYENPNSFSNYVRWGIGLSLLFFFFTKYPYGLMLFIALGIVEILRSPSRFRQIFLHAWQNHYTGIRRILLILILLTVASLPILKRLHMVNPDLRIYKLMFYYLSLPVFLDFNYYIWKHRKQLEIISPKTINAIYVLGIMPSLFWIYLNPDRVTSLIGASNIVNKFTKSFFYSLIASPSGDIFLPLAVFDNSLPIRSLVIASFVSMFVYILLKQKSQQTEKGLQDSSPKIGFLAKIEFLENKYLTILKDPLICLTLIIFLQIFILEITTPNKQQRYVLQFIPSIVLLGGLWILRPMLDGYLKGRWQIAWQIFSALVFLICIGTFASERGFWTKNYNHERYYCLRGEDSSIFEPVRWMDQNLPLDQNLILVNGFHDDIHFDKPGRLLASEIDVVIRMSRYKNHIVRNDHKYNIKNWNDYETLVTIGPNCSDSFIEEKIKKRALKLGVELQKKSISEHGSGNYCMIQYTILKKAK